jgi:hypothetical protein
MTGRVSPSACVGDPDGVPACVPQTSAETPTAGHLTSQVSGEIYLSGSQPDSSTSRTTRTTKKEEHKTARSARRARRTMTAVGEKPASEHTERRSGRKSAQAPSGTDLTAWAAAMAAKFPPLTKTQVAVAARMAAHLDAIDSQEPTA